TCDPCGSHAGHAHVSYVYRYEVVSCAELDIVLHAVRTAVRAELDVVDVRRPAATSRRLAVAQIALHHPVPQRIPLLFLGLPRLQEVADRPEEALSGRQWLLREGAGDFQHVRQQLDGVARDRNVQPTPRPHLRFLLALDLAAQRDARLPPPALDPVVDGPVRGLPGDQPRLLVGDTAAAHRLPQLREHREPALQRDALLHRAHSHAQPLLAVLAERGELRVAPEP